MLIAPASGWTILIPGLCVTGVGVGLASPILASAALTAAPPHRAGMANGAMNTFRQIGFALAVPVFATVATTQARHILTDPTAAKNLISGSIPAGAHDTLRAAYAAGLDRVFLLSGIAALLAGAAVLALVRNPEPADATSAT